MHRLHRPNRTTMAVTLRVFLATVVWYEHHCESGGRPWKRTRRASPRGSYSPYEIYISTGCYSLAPRIL